MSIENVGFQHFCQKMWALKSNYSGSLYKEKITEKEIEIFEENTSVPREKISIDEEQIQVNPLLEVLQC